MFDAIVPVNCTGTYERKRNINNADTPERWFPMYLETNSDDAAPRLLCELTNIFVNALELEMHTTSVERDFATNRIAVSEQ